MPPGWMLDPLEPGDWRWWDGLRWTGAVRFAEDVDGLPLPAPSTPPPASAVGPPRKQSAQQKLRRLDQKMGLGGRVQDLGGQPLRLQRRFHRLGDLRGRHLNDIVHATGRPSSVSALPYGQLVQWQAFASTGGYHLVAEFDADGRCIAVTHESQS